LNLKKKQITRAIPETIGLLATSFGGILIYSSYQEENPLGK